VVYFPTASIINAKKNEKLASLPITMCAAAVDLASS
jgi:hypothetical protein